MKKKILILFLFLLASSIFQFVEAYTQNELDSANTLAGSGIIVYQADPNLYRLDDTITRKEFMKVFVRLIGSQIVDGCRFAFLDVGNDWGCKYIEWAFESGYIAGNLNFRPNDNITKAESMKLILKARNISRIQNSGDWRADDMITAYKRGIISEQYTDYNTDATRGWIFEIAATPIGSYVPGGLGTGNGSTSSSTSSSSSSSGGGGGGSSSSSSSSTSSSSGGGSSITPEVFEAAGGIENPSVIGFYRDYDTLFLSEQKYTVLFFHASWCPSCSTADINLSSTDFYGSDIAILKVDYDFETSLRSKYGVTQQHTFVQVDGVGEIIHKWVGSLTLDQIKDNISER